MSSTSDTGKPASQYRVAASWDIARVPAEFPVGFCLLTAGGGQYIAYYDEQRRMTVAARRLESPTWTYQILPSTVGWDSHNYITMAMDDDGQLHVSGNMHCVPLIYFRTETPGDITTLAARPMTGQDELRCTYPTFMRDADDRLLFHYRNGGSGNGNEIYNVYDPAAQRWSRLMDQPFTDGHGRMNAYMAGPTRGPDGWFHLHWVWRDTPDCATNHHLSYARSRDMLHWESAFGDSVDLPIALESAALWVDPIPSGGGIINGGHRLFFDHANRPIISYHKADADGHMQVYAARPDGGDWTRQVLTDWQTPVEFGGTGSMEFIGIRISAFSRVAPGVLTLTYRHRDHGTGRLFVDEETLRPLDRTYPVVPMYPAALEAVESSFAGVGIRRAVDLGDAGEPGVRYVLQWETLECNRDRPLDPPLPAPSTLRLHKLDANG